MAGSYAPVSRRALLSSFSSLAMDPVTAIGLVSGILTFVPFGTKLVKGIIEIREALDGTLDENRTRQEVAQEMKRLSARILPPDDTKLVAEENGLRLLAKSARRCRSS
ncbi:hypothetical protein QC763_0049540 [Podospora pseudopauciseta]|uniref:Uncharacterized protein n=1 Tax=Podospora pseudopauciseta TaxID=2093780 RepID=A0ABR0HFS2_9PEZI|nr:hypothetical protein QC763_0049540 [Podospora pseudopauciseta]